MNQSYQTNTAAGEKHAKPPPAQAQARPNRALKDRNESPPVHGPGPS